MEKNPLLGSRSNLLIAGEDAEWASRSFHLEVPSHSHRHHHHQHGRGHHGLEYQPLFGIRSNLTASAELGGGMGSTQTLSGVRASAGPHFLQRSNSRLNLSSCFGGGLGVGVLVSEDPEGTPLGSSSRVNTLSSLSGSRGSLNAAPTCAPSACAGQSTSSSIILGAQSYNLYSSLPTRSASELASSRMGSSSLLSTTRTSFLAPGSGAGLGLGLGKGASTTGSYYNSNSSLSSLHSKSSMSSYRERDLSTSRTSISRAPSTASVSRDRDYSSIRERDYGASSYRTGTGIGSSTGTGTGTTVTSYASPTAARYSRYDSVQRYAPSAATPSVSASAAASSSPTRKYGFKLDTLEKADDWRTRNDRPSDSPDRKPSSSQKVGQDTYTGKHEVLYITSTFYFTYNYWYSRLVLTSTK